MSIKLMSMVYERVIVGGHRQAVLLVLADHARDDGSKVYPTIESIAWKLGLTRRPVQKAMAWLRQKGVLIVVSNGQGGRGFATEYRIDLAVLPAKPAERRRRAERDAKA
jgi:biotin operon repressor